MRFDLVDLSLVLHITEAASITHGAARSGMALASASERIRAMEEALGVPLFDRKRRGVSPTAAGTALVHHARLVTQQIERMRGELNQHTRGLRGRIRLLSNTAATLEFLPSVIGAFLSAHPNIDLDLEERSSPEIVRAVAGGRADIGIVADAVDAAAELETFAFAEDRLVVVTPQRHALGKRRQIAFRDTLQHDFVGLAAGSALQDHLNGHAARAGHRLKLRVRLPAFDAICRVVESGIGIAIVSRSAALRCRKTMALHVIPLTDPWARRHLRICVRDPSSLPAHARSLVEHLRARRPTPKSA
jgi:DNA-binding transcriptional LysR family regulator